MSNDSEEIKKKVQTEKVSGNIIK